MAIDDQEMIIEENRARTVDKRTVWSVVLVVSVVFNVCLVVGVGVLSHSKASHSHDTCTSAACVRTSGAVSESLNLSHDPCSDFYEHACGGYKLHHNIEEGTFTTSATQEMYETHTKRLRMAIEAADQTQHYGRTINQLYESCMDLVTLNTTDARPLLDIINNGDSMQWPLLKGADWKADKFDLTTNLAYLHKLNINSFFSLTKAPNPLNPNKVTLKIYPAGLNMYRWYYNSDNFYNQKRAETFKSTMVDLAVKLGANKTIATKDVSDAFEFESKLAKLMPYQRDLYTPHQIRLRGLMYNYISLPEQFSWKDYIAAMYPEKMQPAQSTHILIEDKHYYSNLSDLLTTTSDRVIANYLGVSLVYALADHLPEHVSGAISAHKRYDYIKSPLYIQCASMAEQLMPFAAARVLLDKGLMSEKTSADSVFEALKVATIEMLDKTDQLYSDKFSRQLRERVKHLHEKIGYPDWVGQKDTVNQYYANVSLDRAQYFQNVISMSTTRKQNVLLSVEKTYEENESWDMAFTDASATYYLHGNDILLPSYFLYAPFYHHEMPPAFNFGGMGFYMGWFINYAMTTDYRRFTNDKGDIIPVEPSEADKAALAAKASCYDYIANVTYVPPGYPDGVKINYYSDYLVTYFYTAHTAYKAFKDSSDSGFSLAPGLSDTPDQLFFLSIAQYYCTARYDARGYQSQLLNAVAASRPEFAEAFNCPAGAPLNPGIKCDL